MGEIEKRSAYLDIVKAFAIICVGGGHCIQYGSGNAFLVNKLYFDNIIFKIIYSFHMPLFMLISGYLFAFSINKRKWSSHIAYRLKTLVVPILIWSIIPFALSLMNLYYYSESISLLIVVKEYVYISLRNLWFLWAIFLCSFVVIIVHHFFKDSIFIYILGLLLTFFISDALIYAGYKFMYPFFLIGYFYNLKNGKEKYKRIYQKNISLVIIGVVFVGLLFLYEYESYIYTSGYCIIKEGKLLKQLYNDIYRFVVGSIGSIFIMLILNKCYIYFNSKVSQVLLYIGQNSLGVYIISDFIFSYFLNRIMYNLISINYLITIIETLVILTFSLLCTSIIRRSRILNKFLLGGR